MSNALALASVMAVIKDLLDNAVADQSISGAVGAPVTVTASPPDRVRTDGNEPAQLNLFLYHVAPNAAWRNAALPSRGADGTRLTNPPLALDLYFLLTAYGRNDFDREILLGYGMQVLHETPVLTREAVRRTLASPSPVSGGSLPPAVGTLRASDLAEQAELVKIRPHALPSDELARLWAAFQARYRPTVAYQASLVLIEAAKPARAAFPVLTRGEYDPVLGRDEGVVVHAGRPAFPALRHATPPALQATVRLGERLALAGESLAGDSVRARFTSVYAPAALELAAEPDGDDHGFVVQLPAAVVPPAVPPGSPLHPASWRAGIHAVAAVVQRGDRVYVTNGVPAALAPTIVSAAAAAVAEGIQVTITCVPPVWRGQRASLVVGQQELPADPFDADTSDTLTFTAPELPSGEQWIRLRVDGVESVLVDRGASPPAFEPSETVTVP